VGLTVIYRETAASGLSRLRDEDKAVFASCGLDAGGRDDGQRQSQPSRCLRGGWGGRGALLQGSSPDVEYLG
jgi:hypothetical protein